jgi:hypothetical protein
MFIYDKYTVRKMPANVEYTIDLEEGKKPLFQPLYYQS